MTVETRSRGLLRWHRQTEDELDWAYQCGVLDERYRIAAGHAELDRSWRPIGRVTEEQRVQARIAEMERHAAENKNSTYRGNFPGGATIRRSSSARAVRPLRFKHDPDAYEFVPDDGPDSALTLATPVPWEPSEVTT